MKFSQISAGRDRSVALSTGGTAYGWGGIKLLGATLPPGYPGELCTTNATEIGHNRYAQTVPQVLNPGHPFSSAVDGYADVLAVAVSGQVVSCRPVVSQTGGAMHSKVVGLPTSPMQVASTESGAYALYADGSVWSWGLSASGQLGRLGAASVTVDFTAPGLVNGLPPMKTLAAGHAHVVGLDINGKVWTWGANGAGQLGNGQLASTTIPGKIKLPARIVKVAAGDTHSFAIDGLGRVWGWGSNHLGQVGHTLDEKRAAKYFTTPQRIKTGFAVAHMDAGMFYSVASSTQGDVFAWGWNAMGQLGRDGVDFSVQPLQIKKLRNVSRVAAGLGHVLALNDAGVSAWGDNRSSACGVFPSISVQVQPHPVYFA